MYLSRQARNAYFDLQEALVQALELDDPAPLRELIRGRGSALRTAMAEDVETRLPPRLVGDRVRDVDVADERRRAETAGAIERELRPAAPEPASPAGG
jgi:hypothetical protein